MKGFLVGLAVLGSLALGGCIMDSKAEKAVRRILNDPNSAQFSDMKPGDAKGDVCGYVNAKNRMGGFVGKTPFVYEGSLDFVTMVQDAEDSDFRMIYLSLQSTSNSTNDWKNAVMKCDSIDRWNSSCSSQPRMEKHRYCPLLRSGATLAETLIKEYGR